MSWKEKLFTLIGKRFVSKEEYFNDENGHRFVLINNEYIAVLKSECPPNTTSFHEEYGEYYIYKGGHKISDFYLYYLPYSVRHVYQCFGLEETDITENYTTIDIPSSIGFFQIHVQQEI